MSHARSFAEQNIICHVDFWTSYTDLKRICVAGRYSFYTGQAEADINILRNARSLHQPFLLILFTFSTIPLNPVLNRLLQRWLLSLFLFRPGRS